MKEYIVKFSKGQAAFKTKDRKKAEDFSLEVKGKIQVVDNAKK